MHAVSEAKQKPCKEIHSLKHRNKPWVSLKVILATTHTIELNGCWSVTEICQEILGLTKPWSQLGSASFLILSLWKLNCWTTEVLCALPNSPLHATRDEQTEKKPFYWEAAEDEEGVTGKGKEQLRWYLTHWTGRQIPSNLDYSITFKKSLMNIFFRVISNVLSYSFFFREMKYRRISLKNYKQEKTWVL